MQFFDKVKMRHESQHVIRNAEKNLSYLKEEECCLLFLSVNVRRIIEDDFSSGDQFSGSVDVSEELALSLSHSEKLYFPDPVHCKK